MVERRGRGERGEVEGGPGGDPTPGGAAPAAGPATVQDVLEGARTGLGAVVGAARRWVDRGRYRKLRISRDGKPLLPDIPLAAVAVAELAALQGAGLARLLAVNVGARFLFDVEVINEADRHWKEGVERLLCGDLDGAEQALRTALRIDDRHAPAQLQLGVLHRLRGDLVAARAALERARALDGSGEVGRKAAELLRALGEPSP